MPFEIKNPREEAILYWALAAKRDEYWADDMPGAAVEVDDMIGRLLEMWVKDEPAAPKAAPNAAPFRLVCKNKLAEEIGY